MLEAVDAYLARQSIRGSHSIEALPPFTIAGRRQLMLDDAIVEDTWNCRRVVHRPTKHPQNPLIPPGSRIVGRGMPWTSVLFDEDLGRFRLWGSAHPHDSEVGGYRGVYFESEDGVEWRSPALGSHPMGGDTANNIFFTVGQDRVLDNLAVTRLPSGWEHLGRFVMVVGSYPAAFDSAGGRIELAFSDDGLSWTRHPSGPALAAVADTHNNLVHDPNRDVFLLYLRPTITAYHVRRIAVSESRDLVTWTQPRTVLLPDELDPPMFYGMTVDRYQDLFLGALMVYYRTDADGPVPLGRDSTASASRELPKELQMENHLAWSKDGLHWARHPERPVFLETGRRYAAHDWGFVRKGTGIVERGDLLYLYYQGADRIKKTGYTDRFGEWSLNLATLRKDGFVSLDSQGEGFVLTVPVAHTGGRLHLNARTNSGGRIRVGVRRADGARDGEWVPGMTFEGSVAIEGDSTDHVVEWVGGPDPRLLVGASVRFHIWLTGASVYSFWLD